MELLDADFGHWAWGRGKPLASDVIPIALITRGYSDSQKALMIQMSLDPETKTAFRIPILKRMGDDPQNTCVRTQIVPDDEWEKSRMRSLTMLFGADEWVHSVRYSAMDTWSNLFLLRSTGKPAFGLDDIAILDLAIGSIDWLHATAEETIPKEVFSAVTVRQSMVMLMLLDGYSRKVIAARLGITQETVGDHIKAIYRHFNVNSATELAATFLRSR